MTLLSDDVTAEQKPEPEKDHQKKKGCFSWLLRASLVFLLLLGIVLAWLNGPGFRWMTHKYVPGILAKAGFEGDLQVSGTLLGGINIDTISLKSETSSLKSLEAKDLQLRYKPLELRESKLQSLSAGSLTVDLDLAQSSDEPKEEKEPSQRTLAGTLAKYREIALIPEIRIRDLNLHVHKGEQNYYQLNQAELSHRAGESAYQLTPGDLRDFQNDRTTPPLATITWNTDSIHLDKIPIAKSFNIRELTFVPEPLLADGSVELFGSELLITSDLRSQVDIELKGADLDLQPFLDLAPAAEGIEAQVTTLEVTSSHLDEAFSQWKIDLLLALDEVVVDKRELPPTRLTVAKEGLAAEAKLRFLLDKKTEPEISIMTSFDATTAEQAGEAWKNSASIIRTKFASLKNLLTGLAPTLSLPEPPDGWPEGRAGLTASLLLEGGEVAPSAAVLEFSNLQWAEAVFREGQLSAAYFGKNKPLQANLSIVQNAQSSLTSTASFLPENQGYKATFVAQNFLADSLMPFIRLSVGDFPLSGAINLDWQGSGELPNSNTHQGKLALQQTRIAVQEQPAITVNLAAKYRGLEEVDLDSLEVTLDDQRLLTELHWDGERVTIPKLSITKGGQEIVTGRASLPFQKDQEMAQYFSDETPWEASFNADRLDIPATGQLFGLPVPEGLLGVLTLAASVGGSPADPVLNGKLRLDGFSLERIRQLPATDANLSWATAGDSLTLDGTITPQGRNPITVNGNTTFFPKKWAENPESFFDEKFTAQVNAPNIALSPFAELSPTIKSLEGKAVIQVTADGTFRTPNLNGSVEVDLPKGRFDIERLRRVRQTSLKVKLDGDIVRIAPSSLSTDGGVLGLSGTIGIKDTTNPVFDLRVTGDKLLLWRDDNINSRADAALSLRGTLEQARIAGEIAIVESLFYKDIELLPLDVPVSMPKAPKLPKLAPAGAKKKNQSQKENLIPIPEPFANWTLDLRARTQDPFLVRGNLTEGEVNGGLRATGTLANPRLNGELVIEEFSAALPFSTLTIEGGKAVFTPEGGFIPKLDIRARSDIAPYNVSLFVAGKATSPTITFSSNPPLPENEIITLVATGTTSSGLEDADAAKGKAFQLLIEQIRRAPPGSPLHPLARFAEPLKDVELQVAGSDPFTGKRRNSVTVPIPNSTRWNVSAAVDSESNTRGLIIYLLRFN